MLCGWVEVYNLCVCGWVGRYRKGPTAVGNQWVPQQLEINVVIWARKLNPLPSSLSTSPSAVTKKKYKKMGAEVVTYVTDTNYGH